MVISHAAKGDSFINMFREVMVRADWRIGGDVTVLGAFDRDETQGECERAEPHVHALIIVAGLERGRRTE
jgi:hypothetical protein